MRKRIFLNGIAVLFAFISFQSSNSIAQNLDVPYVPTPTAVVEKMLDMAKVGPGDFVIDLGSGDGRIVIAAALRGAYGLGVDIDPRRVKEANENAIKAGVADRVVFLEQNIFDTDLSRAKVVTMYLLYSVNVRLKPTLFQQLKPGTRVVSHSFSMGEWMPDDKATVEYIYIDIFNNDYVSDWQPTEDEVKHNSEEWDEVVEDWKQTIEEKRETINEFLDYADVYYWVMPANAQGSWSWSTNGDAFSLKVDQVYQKIEAAVKAGRNSLEVKNAQINGERISFSVYDPKTQTQYAYSGSVEGDDIVGSVLIISENLSKVENWSAKRSK